MDDALRDLERRYRTTGAPADEAAWARERARAGRLAPWRLELAARCGHPGLGGVESPPLGFEAWLAALPFAGRRGGTRKEWARVLLAAARALEPTGLRLGLPDEVSLLLGAAERAALGLPDDLDPTFAEHSVCEWCRVRHWDTREPLPPFVAIALVALAALDCTRGRPLEVARLVAYARAALEPAPPWSLEPGLEAAIEADFPRAEGRLWRLRERIAGELLAWALEREDPLRARVEGARA